MRATLIEFNHTDLSEPCVTAYLDNDALHTRKIRSLKHLLEFLNAVEDQNACDVRVANTETENIPAVPDLSEGRLLLSNKAFLIDAGHAKSQAGAHGTGPAATRPEEYQLNLLQAQFLRDELEKLGATATLYDPNPDNLVAVGQRAAGKSCAIFLHHNAANADGHDEGTEAYIHPLAGTQALSLADSIVANVAKALRCTNRGVKRAKYTVLSESIKTSCPINILVESYFVDDYSSRAIAETRSRQAASAILEAIIRFYR